MYHFLNSERMKCYSIQVTAYWIAVFSHDIFFFLHLGFFLGIWICNRVPVQVFSNLVKKYSPMFPNLSTSTQNIKTGLTCIWLQKFVRFHTQKGIQLDLHLTLPRRRQADLFLHSCETESLQNLVKNNNMKDALSFNLTHSYIYDVLSIYNPSFGKWLPYIYPPELELQETIESACSVFIMYLHLEFDNSIHLSITIYNKRQLQF